MTKGRFSIETFYRSTCT